MVCMRWMATRHGNRALPAIKCVTCSKSSPCLAFPFLLAPGGNRGSYAKRRRPGCGARCSSLSLVPAATTTTTRTRSRVATGLMLAIGIHSRFTSRRGLGVGCVLIRVNVLQANKFAFEALVIEDAEAGRRKLAHVLRKYEKVKEPFCTLMRFASALSLEEPLQLGVQGTNVLKIHVFRRRLCDTKVIQQNVD